MADFIIDPDGYLVAYTDGACFNNGRRDARAGIGVWFRGHSAYNISEPVTGRATNNNAEIQAVTAAAYQALQAGFRLLRIYTDSSFVINCATHWMDTWKKNGWRTAEGQNVINKVELLDMDEALSQLDDVKFVHVRGHKTNYGNKEADRLAREGAELYNCYY